MRSFLRLCALWLWLIAPISATASSLTPTDNFFPVTGSGVDTGGDGLVAVTAPGGTAWTAVSNVSWLSIETGASGTGTGLVTFSVAPNSTGAVRVGTLTIAGQTFTVTQLGPAPATNSASLVEYYDGVDDDYFLTGDPAEQQALNAAAQAGAVWSMTGLSFNSGGDASVYRFIYKSPSGVNTHFYTVNTHEQSSLRANNPIWVQETPVAFYMKAANANQTCPFGYDPVYRAAHIQTGSHRFATQQSAINQVLARGWTNEGVAFCAPATGVQTAEGFWTGSTSTARSIETTILDDGTYYFLYTLMNNPLLIGGFLQGTGTSLNGTFSSSNGRNYSLETGSTVAANLSVSYSFKQSLIGTVSYPSLGLSTSFTSSYSAKYELQPSLSAVAGTYNGQMSVIGGAGSLDATSLIISASGLVYGQASSGCNFTGTYSPRTRGNLYDWRITFGGGDCVAGTSTFTGIGYYDESTNSLRAMATSADRTDGVVYVGASYRYTY
jgi:hypothetical protein